MNPWAKMASDLDTDDKIMAAGRNAREVFLYALRKNQLGGYDWVIPAGCMRPAILARILMMSEDEACNGVTAAVTEGLFELTESGDYRIAAGEKWGDAGGGNAMSARERVAKHRERKRIQTRNEPVTIGNVTETPIVTVTTEEKRREEKRSEERSEGEGESSPSASPPQGAAPPVLALVPPEPKRKRKAPEVPLPADWAPNAKHRELARAFGKDLELEAERMRDRARAKAERFADWDARFNNWLRDQFGSGSGNRGSPSGRHHGGGGGPLTGLDAFLAQQAEEKNSR